MSLLADLITQALATDAKAQARLQAMSRRVIRLQLAPLPTLGLCIEAGQLTFTDTPQDPDLVVHGHLGAFARFAITGKAADIRLDGEIEGASEFRDFIRQLDIDWEELLAKALGDSAAHLLSRSAQEATTVARQVVRALEHNTRDYLHHESDLLPSRAELDRFVHQVDCLRDDLERLELRLGRHAA